HSPELGMKWLLPSGFMPFGTDKEGKIKTLLCPADKEVMSAAADTGNPRRKHEKKTKGITLLPNGPQATVVLPDGSCSTIMFSEKAAKEAMPYPFATCFQFATGPGTVAEKAKSGRVSDITSKKFEKVLIVVGDRPVPWTKPEDLNCEPGK